MWKNHVFCLLFYVGGAELYHNLTAKVKASVRSLIASGPQFHLRIRYTDPVPTQFRPGPDSGRMSAYCATHSFRESILGFLGYQNWGGLVPKFSRLCDVVAVAYFLFQLC